MNRKHETIRIAVTAAFKALRVSKGYIARQNFSCCSSCASSEIAFDFETKHKRKMTDDDKSVTYHRQANAAFDDEGNLKTFSHWTGDKREERVHRLWLGWSGDGAEIVAALAAEGLATEWDGTHATKIAVCGWLPPPVIPTHHVEAANFAAACGME